MPKFKIEMELTSITERILLTDFDSSEGTNNGITFNETLTEEENNLYRLNFSIAEDFGRTETISIGKLISIGRPIWVHTNYPNRSIRMVISSFTPIIGSENVIYEIEAQDYASYVFSRNNVGLSLNTFEDPDFIDWAEEREISLSPKIEDIANHILQRGWLQKFNGEGWQIEVDNWPPEPNLENIERKSEMILNLEISESNTYNALVSLANLSNTFLDFDYDYPTGENPKIYFLNKENLNLDKNYTIKRGVNLENFNLKYGGENLYSIFYIDGAEDEFGFRTLLTDATEYKDNFIFNFNYFKDRSLIPNSQAIENSIEQDLKNINIELQSSIQNRFRAIGRIRELETEIGILTDAIMLSNKDRYVSSYTELLKIFKTRAAILGDTVTKSFSTPPFTLNWASISIPITNLTFNYPISITYSGELWSSNNGNFVIEDLNFDIILNTSGFSQNGIPFNVVVNDGDFDIEELRIITSRAIYSQTVNWNSLKVTYPYFLELDNFDGQNAINKAKEMWEEKVELYKTLWEEDYDHLQCLNGAGTECDRFFIPTDSEPTRLGMIEDIENRINKDYKIAIGDYNPQTQILNPNIPGKYTTILKLFEEIESEYTLMDSNKKRIMEIYREAADKKQEFWYNLKKNRQHIFIEGYYENDFESSPEILKSQAEAVYKNFQLPSEDFGITYIDISDIVGVNINQVRPGEFINLREEKLNIISSEESKLRVGQVSRTLRDKSKITLTIYRYNMINTLLEKIMASSQ